MEVMLALVTIVLGGAIALLQHKVAKLARRVEVLEMEGGKWMG